MSSLRKALLYCGLDKDDYDSIVPLISERNFSFSNIISLSMIAFGLIFLVSQLLTGATILFPYYFLICSGLLFFAIRQFMMRKSCSMTLLYRYLQLCVIFIFLP